MGHDVHRSPNPAVRLNPPEPAGNPPVERLEPSGPAWTGLEPPEPVFSLACRPFWPTLTTLSLTPCHSRSLTVCHAAHPAGPFVTSADSLSRTGGVDFSRV